MPDGTADRVIQRLGIEPIGAKAFGSDQVTNRTV